MRITINESESRTVGNEEFHRRMKMAIIYRVTVVLNFTLYLPTKIDDLSQKLFRLENVSKRNTRVRYCAVAATDWLVRLHQRYPLRTYQPSYHLFSYPSSPLLWPFSRRFFLFPVSWWLHFSVGSDNALIYVKRLNSGLMYVAQYFILNKIVRNNSITRLKSKLRLNRIHERKISFYWV